MLNNIPRGRVEILNTEGCVSETEKPDTNSDPVITDYFLEEA